MSTLGYNRLGRYATGDVTPEWYRCERYEYCEPFFHDEFNKKKGKKLFYPLQTLLSLFF